MPKKQVAGKKLKRVTAFFAFPSRPPMLAETLQATVVRINKSRVAKVTPWTTLSKVGTPIITQITRAIDDAQIFACDLTYINPNVIFELGYAVGTLKPVWVSLDVSIEGARDGYRQIHPTLVPIMYASYTNSEVLAESFIKNYQSETGPHEHLLGRGFEIRSPQSQHPSLLYLKSPIDTDASIVLSHILDASYFKD